MPFEADVATDPNNCNRLERVDPHDPNTIRAAQRTVARHATDAGDAALLLAMLGLDGSGAPRCKAQGCDEPISRLTEGGYHQTTGDGLCRSHLDSARRRGTDLLVPETRRAAPSNTVDATATIAHLKKLRDSGRLLSEIADLAEMSVRSVCKIPSYTRVRKSTADKICAIAPLAEPRVGFCTGCGRKFPMKSRVRRCIPCRNGLVPVGPAREHLYRIQRAIGGGNRRMGAFVGLREDTVGSIVNQERKDARSYIRAELEAQILAIEVPEAES